MGYFNYLNVDQYLSVYFNNRECRNNIIILLFIALLNLFI